MKILITGATGLVGKKLLEKLILSGYDNLRILTRNKKRSKKKLSYPLEIFEWNPEESTIEQGALKGVDVIVHLAGENIASSRWTKNKKRKIINSRILSTRLLINEIKKLDTKPKKLISSSAIGIYGPNNKNIITTKSKLGNDFLAKVCKCWEKELSKVQGPSIATHSIRTGIVLSLEGGALSKMLPAFNLGIAGKLGSGNQYMSWIHIDDLVGQILFLIENKGQSKVYNGTAPHPVTNKQFTKNLGNILNRFTLFPVPAFILKLALGELSTILLTGQKVMPINFLKEGYRFKFPTLQDALIDLLKYKCHNETIVKNSQWVEKPSYKVFSYFTNRKNIEFNSPSYLKYNFIGNSTNKIIRGSIIKSQFKIFGLPLKWKLKISDFKFGKSFTDEQVYGPCERWNHQHNFIPYHNGTLIYDKVVFQLPFGPIGRFMLKPFFKKNLKRSLTFVD